MLDTSVVSVLAPGREALVPRPLSEWLLAHHKALFLPAIAVADMAQGIGKLRRAGGIEWADRLDRWLDGLLATYADRILPLDAQAARLAGQMSDAAIAQDVTPVLPMSRSQRWLSTQAFCCSPASSSTSSHWAWPVLTP
jgi:predicted nucleic acid-binding protein